MVDDEMIGKTYMHTYIQTYITGNNAFVEKKTEYKP